MELLAQVSDRDVVALLAIALAGVVTGYGSGLFGIGGGLILVPVFLTVFPYFRTSEAVVMHCAVGTSLALVVPTSIASSRKQRRLGNLDPALLRMWVPFVLVGVVCGGALLGVVSTQFLKILFTAFLVGCTIYSIARRTSSTTDGEIPRGIVFRGTGVVIGALSVLLGIAGGTFTVPVLTMYRYPLKRAIAVASASGFFIGLGGAVGAMIYGWGVAGRTPHSIGYVNVPAVVCLSPLLMLLSPWGSKAANDLPEPVLRWIYTGLLATLSVYMTIKVF